MNPRVFVQMRHRNQPQVHQLLCLLCRGLLVYLFGLFLELENPLVLLLLSFYNFNHLVERLFGLFFLLFDRWRVHGGHFYLRNLSLGDHADQVSVFVNALAHVWRFLLQLEGPVGRSRAEVFGRNPAFGEVGKQVGLFKAEFVLGGDELDDFRSF